MMVGGTMCGKSTIISTLQQGLTIVSEFKARLNEKGISMNPQTFIDQINQREREIEEEKLRTIEEKRQREIQMQI